jgi:uncharacterized zinc-type alcohol dehydrogenase-like protein
LLDSKGYAAVSATEPLRPYSFQRRDLQRHDIQIEIQYCGVCHSDLHTARNEWQNTTYPVVPGHEIVGKVVKVGDKVKKFKVGDTVGVGCMVDSCRTCASCRAGEEQYCEGPKGFIGTYNAEEGHVPGMTFGGYSNNIIVTEHFVLRIPENLDLAAAAPLLCAGITTYSPLHHWGVGPGQKVGVVGLGGLGHMAIKIAHAMGAHVVMFTTSPSKVNDGKKLGADEVVITRNPEELTKHANTFDFIIDTVSAHHDINPYLDLLKRDKTLVQVGAPEVLNVSPFSLIFKRRSLAGSLIGGIKETQDMLDFCGKHNLTSDIELIPIDKINDAYERMLKSDVKYRFVIDIKGSLQ